MYLTAAGLLMIAIGAVHSVIGERKIFMPQQDSALIPAAGALESGRFRGILRASWHATTFFGMALAAVLLHHSLTGNAMHVFVRLTIASALAGSSLAVLCWTRGRHPGWLALGAAAALTAAG